MSIARSVAITCALAAAGHALAAQSMPAGSVVLSVTVRLPDSIKAKVPVGDSVSIRLTASSDGNRFAIGVIPGPMTAMPMLDGVSLRAIYSKAGDSLHVGIMLPAAMAPMAGGAPGMRMDLSMATVDSTIGAATGKFDSSTTHVVDSVMAHAPRPVIRSLGTTSTVAGLQCENWETITTTDTVTTCLIPTPPMLQAFQDHMKAKFGLDKLLEKYPQLSQMQSEAYGGRHLTPIRVTTAKSGMRMELVSITIGMPDAAEFELPAGLKPMPVPALPGKPPTTGSPGLR